MATSPSAELAELLEEAPSQDRQAITAWLLDSRLTLPATSVEDFWATRRLRATQIIRDLAPGENQAVTVRFPQDLHGLLRGWCAAEGFSMAAVVRGLVERFLAERRSPSDDSA